MRRILFFFFTIFYLFSPAISLATSGLTISPPTLEIMMAPTKNVVQNITVNNLGESTEWDIALHRLIPIGENGQSTIDLKELSPTNIPFVLSINGQALPLSTPITLPTEIPTELSLNIESASQDKSEAYPLALSFSPANNSSIAAEPMIVLPLFITLTSDGALDLSFTLSSFDLPTLFDSLLPFTIYPKADNTSNFMHRPGGELVVTSPDGNQIKSAVTPELILGGTSRLLNFDKEINLAPSIGRVGPYTFNLKLTTPGGTTILESTRTVWFLPIRLILVTFIILCLFIAIYLRSRRLREIR